MTVTIPVPPSANSVTGHGRGRHYRSHEYAAWLRAAAAAIRMSQGAEVAPPAVVHIRVGRIRANRDIDNLVKPVLDVLREAGVLADDDTRHVREVRVWLDETAVPPGCATVTVQTQTPARP